MMLFPLLAIAAQIGNAAPPVQAQISAGWVCPTRPVQTDVQQLEALHCVRTPLAQLDPQGRELWFVADVTIDPAADRARAPVAVAIGAVAASELFWNGTRIGANGTPASTRQQEQPGVLDAFVYLPPQLLRSGRNELLVHMSGFHNRLRLTAPVHYIDVAEYDVLYSVITSRYIPAMMMAGALLVACAYFGSAWLSGTRDTQAFFVAAMAATSLGQLMAEIWRVLWPLPYHWHAWRLLAIEVLAAGFALALIAYVTTRFAPQWRARALWCTAGVPLVTSFLPWGYDPWTMLTITLPIVLALLLVLPAARRRERGAVSIATAFVFFLGLVLVDTWGFLDRGFYFASAALAIVLLRDQWRVGLDAQVRALDARRRVDQLEAQLLRRRFAPHWLLNTLNALTEWIEVDPPTAVRLIEALGEEYHMVVEMAGKPTVSLGEEISLCRRHLDVMSLRVDRAFHLECRDVDEQLRVPPGIVQTLIENAFSHGRYLSGAAFVLCQRSLADGLQLELTAPAPEDGVHAPTHRHRGEGLEYVQAQLRQAFGDTARVADGPIAAGGWRTNLLFGAVS